MYMMEKKMMDWINNQIWIYSKTMENCCPHSYVVIHKNHKDRKIFEDIVMFIRNNGVVERFGKRRFIYYYMGGYKYWTMGDPLDNTWILNRAKAIKTKNRYGGLSKWI